MANGSAELIWSLGDEMSAITHRQIWPKETVITTTIIIIVSVLCPVCLDANSLEAAAAVLHAVRVYASKGSASSPVRVNLPLVRAAFVCVPLAVALQIPIWCIFKARR